MNISNYQYVLYCNHDELAATMFQLFQS